MSDSFTAVRRTLNAASYVSPRLLGGYTFRLFCEPQVRDRVRDIQRPVHDQAAVEEVTVAGRRLVTYRWGEGERPVLLVHGFGGRAINLAGFVFGLRQAGIPVLAYDAFGHGDSGGKGTTILDHVAAATWLQERYGAFRAIVGHSFGATSGYLMLRNGISAERLVSISSVAEFGALPDLFCFQAGLRQAYAAELRRRTDRLFGAEPDFWQRFSPVYRTEEIDRPLLVVHDEKDREVGVEHGRRIADAYGTQARLLCTSGLGHRRILGDSTVIKEVATFAAGA